MSACNHRTAETRSHILFWSGRSHHRDGFTQSRTRATFSLCPMWQPRRPSVEGRLIYSPPIGRGRMWNAGRGGLRRAGPGMGRAARSTRAAAGRTPAQGWPPPAGRWRELSADARPGPTVDGSARCGAVDRVPGAEAGEAGAAIVIRKLNGVRIPLRPISLG
jgi:hypothetical protein